MKLRPDRVSSRCYHGFSRWVQTSHINFQIPFLYGVTGEQFRFQTLALHDAGVQSFVPEVKEKSWSESSVSPVTMKTVIIMQARTNSSRLPGKAMLPVGGYGSAVLAALRATHLRLETVVAA